MTMQVFISYKKIDGKTPPVALNIAAQLKKRGYEAFIDEKKLPTGEAWAREIYRNIWRSGVLIVLLDEPTAQSEWVQREVDVARGAHVSILPLRLETTSDRAIMQAIEKLAINDLQHSKTFHGTPEDYEQLVADIERLAKKTRNAQEAWIEQLDDLWHVQKAPTRKALVSYWLFGGVDGLRVHLATGDMTRLRDIDVLVNTENNYMQMARAFERTTLSASLRRAGALTTASALQEDTVQLALDAQLTQSPHYQRPILAGQVIPTVAGHPDSVLVQRNGVRYLLHAATVMVLGERLVTIEPEELQETVFNCFQAVEAIDAARGVISPEGSSWHEAEMAGQESYRPIRSIAFPLLGTGRGGRDAREVADAMVEALGEYLLENHARAEFYIAEVYLCAFSEDDVKHAQAALDRVFEWEG